MHDGVPAFSPPFNAHAPFIVGFGGATRPASTSERLTAAILETLEKQGARTRLFTGPDLAQFRHYAPENPERNAAEHDFVAAIRAADAVVIGSPVYHGGVSGLIKKAIDLITDLAQDVRIYLDGLPVGLAVTAGGWQGAGVTLSAMRDMVHALRGWPTPLGIAVNTGGQTLFDAQGRILDPAVQASVDLQARQILDFLAQRTGESVTAT